MLRTVVHGGTLAVARFAYKAYMENSRGPLSSWPRVVTHRNRRLADSSRTDDAAGVSTTANPVTMDSMAEQSTHRSPIRPLVPSRIDTTDSDWKYVDVRRLLIYLEHSLDQGLQWAVFEPNAEPLWSAVRASVVDFLTSQWREGFLKGDSAAEAFFVRCDQSTMTQADLDNGRVVVEVGVAPLHPAEFVVFRIGQWTCVNC